MACAKLGPDLIIMFHNRTAWNLMRFGWWAPNGLSDGTLILLWWDFWHTVYRYGLRGGIGSDCYDSIGCIDLRDYFFHDDVMTWDYFLYYCPFVRESSITGALSSQQNCNMSIFFVVSLNSFRINCCFSGTLWYIQHKCVRDTIVYHWNSQYPAVI